MSGEVLGVSREGPVLTLTLRRPKVRNALNAPLVGALLKEVAIAATDRSLRAVVITGEGEAFCAGGDVSRLERKGREGLYRAEAEDISGLFAALEALGPPVIAAINGVATGAGLQLALACDLRLASQSARLGMREHSLGLVPAHGGTVRLARLLGLARAKEVYYHGGLMTAAEAQALGLVGRVVAPGRLLAEAGALAAKIAARAPLALGLAKALLNSAPDRSLKEGLAAEDVAQTTARASRDHREGVAAFREKRPPEFSGR